MDLVIGIRLIVQVCYVYCFLVSFCSLGQQIVLDFAANIKFSIEIAKCTWQKVCVFFIGVSFLTHILALLVKSFYPKSVIRF